MTVFKYVAKCIELALFGDNYVAIGPRSETLRMV